jgi:hypothetical protein
MRWAVIAGLLLVLVACAAEPASDDAGLRLVTAVPTLDLAEPQQLCMTVEANWGDDWPRVIRVLETLYTLDSECGDAYIAAGRLFDAYIAYGDELQQRGGDATGAYENAARLNPDAPEVIARLQSMQIATQAPPPRCDEQTIRDALASMPVYLPYDGAFVRLVNGQFLLDGQTYPIYGVNYYPRDYPGDRFLTEMDVTAIGFELDLIRAAGINTLRLALRHTDLFMCPGNGAIPRVENIARLDALIQAAAQRGFRLILVMNADADLEDFLLYTMPSYVAAQMRFIAERYRLEPAVIAYDLRGQGDQDYLSGAFTQVEVLTWLAEAVGIVREAAPDQLITAGWYNNAADTAPLVDFVSFQHYGSVDDLRQEIAVLRDATVKPLVLVAVGYSTWDMTELEHRERFQRILEAATQNGLGGWIIWTAFDYPTAIVCPDEGCAGDPALYYGLWNVSYFPKQAVDVVKLVTGAATLDEITGG